MKLSSSLFRLLFKTLRKYSAKLKNEEQDVVKTNQYKFLSTIFLTWLVFYAWSFIWNKDDSIFYFLLCHSNKKRKNYRSFSKRNELWLFENIIFFVLNISALIRPKILISKIYFVLFSNFFTNGNPYDMLFDDAFIKELHILLFMNKI